MSPEDGETKTPVEEAQMETRALLIERSGNESIKDLSTAIFQSNITHISYAHKIRVKPYDKLIQKVKRKLKDKPDYSLNKITDVVGLRIVTLFRVEMSDVIEDIIKIIQDGSSQFAIFRNEVEEAIIYSTNPTFDAVARNIKERLLESGLVTSVSLEESNAGYSSIHLVARLNTLIDPAEIPCVYTPIEIQVRTVFEDAWGEIDHKFGYQARSGKISAGAASNADSINRHLRVLKKFADACAEYADAIYKDGTMLDSYVDAEGEIIPIDREESIVERFDALGIPKSIIDEYHRASKLRERSDELPRRGFTEAREMYLNAAQQFNEIFLSIGSGRKSSLSEDARSVLVYYLEMNEALCRLASKVTSEVHASVSIYQNLIEEYEAYPLPFFRLGQAYGRINKHNEALDCFFRAKGLIDELAKLPVEDRLDKLPEVDRLHMERKLPKLVGYQYWSLAENIKVTNSSNRRDKLKLLKDAYDSTAPAVALSNNSGSSELNEVLVDCHNNLLYYAIEYIQNSEGQSDEIIDGFRGKIHQHLDFVEKQVNIDTSTDISGLETIASAYDLINRGDDAVLVADRIVDLVLGQGEVLDGLDKETTIILTKAHEILRRHSG